jgi:hypothetical protein
MSFLASLFNSQQVAEDRRAEIYKSLIHWEGKVGGQLFGPVQKDGRREFFCLDENTWVWHEEWVDETGRRHAITTRYDVRPGGIVKSQGNNNYQALSDEELYNFVTAVNLYYQRVAPELHRMSQPGHK